jgi:hypothetical protein
VLAKQTDEVRGLIAETRSALTELQTRSAQPIPQGERGEQGEAGPQGEKGEQGPPGPAGEQGERGADGINGRDGAPGPQGERGVDGLIGPAGPMGERGADGLNGRDGAPGPQGERGADGIMSRAEFDALFEARFAEIQTRNAAQIEAAKAEARVLNLADSWRGVWKPAETYQRGNIAQWDGSPWLALIENPTTKPGTSQEWVLFAKKGRDGSR